MKIAFIAIKGVPLTDGIVRVTDLLASELARRGHDVTVFTTKNYGNHTTEYNGYKIIALDVTHKKQLEKIVLNYKASKIASKDNFDIYHFEPLGDAFFAYRPHMLKKKVVGQSHGIEYDRPRFNSIIKAILKLYERAGIRNCDAVVVVSKKLYRFYLKKYGLKTTYIPNCTAYPGKTDESLLEQFGIEKNKYFLFLNRIDSGKGLHYLINAYKRMSTDMKLVICGPIDKTNPYHLYVLDLAANNPNIVFTNNVDGVLKNTMYKYAYLCCLTSESEGMSTSLLEMMSFGKCVVASYLEENVDVLEESGIYFISKDEISLQKKLEEAVRDPEAVRKKGQLSYQLWNKNYTIKTVTDSYEEFYRSVINEKNLSN